MYQREKISERTPQLKVGGSALCALYPIRDIFKQAETASLTPKWLGTKAGTIKGIAHKCCDPAAFTIMKLSALGKLTL